MNKFLLLVLFVGFNLSLKSQSYPTYSFSEAISKNLITNVIVSNTESVHYINPIIIKAENKTSKRIYLKISPGDMFIPFDSSFQNIIITGEMIVMIEPYARKTIKPQGMCTEEYDRAGKKDLKYSFKENKNVQLIEISKYIYENKYQDAIGQKALWCVADSKKDLLEIIGYDSISRLKLIKTVASITRKPIPDLKKIRKTYDGYVKPEKKETLGGMFEFSFPVSKKIHIAMFNPNGTLVRELYYNIDEKPGVHKINFEFDYTEYTEEYYTVKLIADNYVLLASKIDGVK